MRESLQTFLAARKGRYRLLGKSLGESCRQSENYYEVAEGAARFFEQFAMQRPPLNKVNDSFQMFNFGSVKEWNQAPLFYDTGATQLLIVRNLFGQEYFEKEILEKKLFNPRNKMMIVALTQELLKKLRCDLALNLKIMNKGGQILWKLAGNAL